MYAKFTEKHFLPPDTYTNVCGSCGSTKWMTPRKPNKNERLGCLHSIFKAGLSPSKENFVYLLQ